MSRTRVRINAALDSSSCPACQVAEGYELDADQIGFWFQLHKPNCTCAHGCRCSGTMFEPNPVDTFTKGSVFPPCAACGASYEAHEEVGIAGERKHRINAPTMPQHGVVHVFTPMAPLRNRGKGIECGEENHRWWYINNFFHRYRECLECGKVFEGWDDTVKEKPTPPPNMDVSTGMKAPTIEDDQAGSPPARLAKFNPGDRARHRASGDVAIVVSPNERCTVHTGFEAYAAHVTLLPNTLCRYEFAGSYRLDLGFGREQIEVDEYLLEGSP